MACHVQVGLKNGLPILSPVDNAGVFTDEAGPFEGVAQPQLGMFDIITPAACMSHTQPVQSDHC